MKFIKEPEDGKVTPNGEITWDKKDNLYTVWDEVYLDALKVTPDYLKAVRAYTQYAAYLNGKLRPVA